MISIKLMYCLYRVVFRHNAVSIQIIVTNIHSICSQYSFCTVDTQPVYIIFKLSIRSLCN